MTAKKQNNQKSAVSRGYLYRGPAVCLRGPQTGPWPPVPSVGGEEQRGARLEKRQESEEEGAEKCSLNTQKNKVAFCASYSPKQLPPALRSTTMTPRG